MGIRAEESFNRKKRGRIQIYKGSKHILYNPIFYFNEGDIWEYIEKYSVPYCKLYDEGFDRLGCIVCPFITGQRANGELNYKLKLSMQRWPRVFTKFEQVATELFYIKKEKRQIRESTPEEYISNWYRDIQIKSKS